MRAARAYGKCALAIKFADKNTKIVMVNHKFPAGLIPKIEKSFDVEREDLEGGAVKMIFSLKMVRA